MIYSWYTVAISFDDNRWSEVLNLLVHFDAGVSVGNHPVSSSIWN